MREVEKGLFQAEYSGEINPTSSNARDIPDAHIGTSAADVKTWVEQMALDLGYDRVVWDEFAQRIIVTACQREIAPAQRGSRKRRTVQQIESPGRSKRLNMSFGERQPVSGQ